MEYVGYGGGILMSVQMYPQIKKVIRTESAQDISATYLVLNVLGLMCIVSYAVSQSDPPIYIPASASLLNSFVLFGFMKYYEHKARHSSVEIVAV